MKNYQANNSYLVTLKSICFIFIIIFVSGCRNYIDIEPTPIDKGDYEIKSNYQNIRSYPYGGGIFVFVLNPEVNFSGTVKLSLQANSLLRAALTKTTLDKNILVTEITVNPESFIELDKYDIILVATHAGIEKRIPLVVNVIQWEQNSLVNILEKRDEFKNWITENYPKYKNIFTQPDFYYHTYPQIIIVEHYTFLHQEYEVRLCYHVMIPPYDWSMIWIRKRNSLEAEFAAKRETDGRIYEIPVSDYPKQLGY